MEICDWITKVAETDDETTFEWNITDFRMTSLSFYESPQFNLTDSSWSLALCPHNDSTLGINDCTVELNRLDEGKPKAINFTLGIKDTNGSTIATFTDSYCFDFFNSSCRKSFIDVPQFRSLFESADKITVTCCMRRYPPPEKTFASVGIQTNVPKTVVENEIPEGDALFRARMKDLLFNDTNHDVILSVQNKEFRAHRNILKARSPVLAMMLSQDAEGNDTGTYRIEDCDPDSFREFLLYVYSGKTEKLTPDKAVQLYYTADKYVFPVLKEQCVSLLKSSLSVPSICDVILLATKHDEEELLEVATEYFTRNMREILLTVEWRRFMARNPGEANNLFVKSMEILLPQK